MEITPIKQIKMKNLESEINDLKHELMGFTRELWTLSSTLSEDSDEYYEVDSLIRDMEMIDGLGLSDEEWIEEAESLIQVAEDLV
jgi:hypothetical protein